MGSYQVLSAPQPSGGEGILNIFAKALMQDEMEKKKKELTAAAVNKAAQSAKPTDKVVREIGPEGETVRITQEQPDTMDAVRDQVLGVASPTETDMLGRNMGIQKPPDQASIPGPEGSYIIPNPNEQNEFAPGSEPQKVNYSDLVSKALLPKLKEFSGVAGLKEKATKEILPDTFKSDIQSAIDYSGNDETKFVEALKKISNKYPDNMEVQKHIKSLIDINTKNTKTSDEDINF